jgi:undecaprenyl diphosphate synthase
MSLEQLLASIPPGSHDETLARQVNFEQLPAHVAIIMDGNGRWAAQRHLPRVEGHRAGIDSVRDVVETSARLGIDVLTLYAFSMENWNVPAPKSHPDAAQAVSDELGASEQHQVRVIGRPDELAAVSSASSRSAFSRRPPNRDAVQHRAIYGFAPDRRRGLPAMAAGIAPDDLDERRWRLPYTAVNPIRIC